MRATLLAGLILCLAQSAPALAQPPVQPVTPAQLRGLDPAEANFLIAKLEEAQAQLKAGKMQTFELLAGSIAAYKEATLSPRQVFLDTPFRQVSVIARTNRDAPRRFKLAYTPRPGQTYWDIE